ncbi:MAG: ABC-F family ATP-binding cassette domain-containing protein [Clostridia bacterium]|nr:ABC-F family ATP-binding cassette domain-containing protein [Clostridia bacterium]
MSILDVKNLTQIYGDKKLFSHADMQLFGGDKLGLTGLNGAGKSTFINILIGEVVPDEGYVKWNPKVKLGYLDQQAKIKEEITVRAYLKRAFDHLFKLEKQYNEINAEISVCKDEQRQLELCEQSSKILAQLESNNFYAINSTIDKVAAGLGITAFGMDTNVSILSGGQRAKVLLAKLLLEQPDVLLLDEPTNFLDKEHIAWLTKFLTNFKGAFILVSHDYDFLDKVVNCICDIENGTITRFNGNYQKFVKLKEAKRLEYEKNYNSQQKEIAKLQTFIDKNIVRASTSAMAKSRRKKLEKMQLLEKPNNAPKPSFLFNYTPAVGKIILSADELAIGYYDQLVPDITMELNAGEKLAVTGFNGIGKSTFIKTICGIVPPLSGSYKLADNVKIGYYEQENIWQNDSITAMEEIKNTYPKMVDKDVRTALSRCGLSGEQVLQKLCTLSGGEQAKVKICKLILSDYNLLVLDEPTNHLDVNAIEQLKVAIKLFEGAVLFVSHSKEFCNAVADNVLDFEKLFD